MVPVQEKDRVLGLLIKNPGIMTRKYVKFMYTDPDQECPYCNEKVGNLVFH